MKCRERPATRNRWGDNRTRFSGPSGPAFGSNRTGCQGASRSAASGLQALHRRRRTGAVRRARPDPAFGNGPASGLGSTWRVAVDRAEKVEVVSSLQQAFASSGAIVVAHYAGLSVAEMESLRRQMKAAGGQVKVAKNRLAKLALKDTDVADFSGILTGPTVIAYSEDPITAPKVAKKFADSNNKF